MIVPGSRYEDSERRFVSANTYDDLGRPLYVDDKSYQRRVTAQRQALYLTSVLPYPDRPPAEYYAKDSEHMPFLAYKFLEDSTAWWRLAEVNPQVWYPLDMEVGDQVRIPDVT